MIGIILASFIAIQLPPVQWFDDFLGVKLNPAYSISLAGNGVVQIASDDGGGGAVLLAALGYGSGVARLRLGEDPVTGTPYNALNFSARKNLVYKTRVYLNRSADTQATIGLIGYHDPQNAIALVLDPHDDGQWGFQAINQGKGITIPTGFTHQPGSWFTVRIETQWGETPAARVFINDEEAPRVEITGEYVPGGGLCPEFQIWNRPLNGAYSQPTMWVDYLSVKQDR